MHGHMNGMFISYAHQRLWQVLEWWKTPVRADSWLHPMLKHIFPEPHILLKYIGGQMGRDSSVFTATRYVLDGPGIQTRWEARVSAPVQTGPGAYLASYIRNGYRVIPGGKAAEAWRSSPTPSSPEVKERVELFLYSPSAPSCLVLGWTLRLHLHRRTDLQSPNLATANVSTPNVWTITMLALRII